MSLNGFKMALKWLKMAQNGSKLGFLKYFFVSEGSLVVSIKYKGVHIQFYKIAGHKAIKSGFK